MRAVLGRIRRFGSALVPGPRVRRGLAWGALTAYFAVTARIGLELATGLPAVAGVLLGLLLGWAILGLAELGFDLARKLLDALPRFLSRRGAHALLALLFLFTLFRLPPRIALLLALVVPVNALLGGAVLAAADRYRPRWRRGLAAAVVALLLAVDVAVVLFLASPGRPREIDPPVLVRHDVPPIAAPDPSRPGPYAVARLTYGSGTDRHRPEYGEEATLTTASVDGTAFTEGLSGWKAKLRRLYWGFGMDALPVNGRVFLPEGPGPFPLALMVHGNHNMLDYSDDGYGWLGEHLASHGIVFVSVDQNFLNGAPFIGGIPTENDARGWLLLEHLAALERFEETPGNPLSLRLDLSRIALMGHSRGGEAAAVAAAFDALARYPDDATVELPGPFGVDAVVAFAPADGQYRPAGQRTPLAGVGYLVLQGGHDSDVSSFVGARQLERVRFAPGSGAFAAGVWIYGANHGQWNTTWGDRDLPWPWAGFLDRAALLPAGEQRRIARVYVTAFLDETLRGDGEAPGPYRRLFRQPEAAGEWLPRSPGALLLTLYRDATFTPWAGYEEDVDVATASLPGARLEASGLAVWREDELEVRGGSGRDDHGVILGWRRSPGGDDEPPSYALTLPPGVEPGELLAFDLAAVDETPPADDGTENQGEENEESPEEEGALEPWDLTVELETADGVVARLPLSTWRALAPPLPSRFAKLELLHEGRHSPHETVFQTFELPLADFARAAPGFEPAGLRVVRFVFDRTETGAVALDDVGTAWYPHAPNDQDTKSPSE